jgi:hypothetical protein
MSLLTLTLIVLFLVEMQRIRKDSETLSSPSVPQARTRRESDRSRNDNPLTDAHTNSVQRTISNPSNIREVRLMRLSLLKQSYLSSLPVEYLENKDLSSSTVYQFGNIARLDGT